MNLTTRALALVAQAIAVSEPVTLATLPATDTDIHCQGCDTNSGALIPLRGLLPTGVQDLGLLAVCGVCDADDCGDN